MNLKIDLGGGRNPKEGFVCVDQIPEAEYQVDLESGSLPFDDGAVDEIYSSHTFEHIENIIPLMNECWRVLKDNGKLEIHVPDFRSMLAWQDPTHKRYWTSESMKFFCGEYLMKYSLDYGIKCCFRLSNVEMYAPTGDVEYCSMIYFVLVKDLRHAKKIGFFEYVKSHSMVSLNTETECKEPRAVLASITPDAAKLVTWARKVMHEPVSDNFRTISQKEAKDYIERVVAHDGMPTCLEYVTLVFKLENVSRALQQQLTRHRIGFSYSIQSLRCVDLPNFADDMAYAHPEDERWSETFHVHMTNIQQSYREALEAGMPTQDARGLLPMNIHSTITFSCSLRAFIGMVNKRLCLKTQGEFRKVAVQMVEQVNKATDNAFSMFFGAPCSRGRCIMEAENEQQYQEGKMTGKQNTDHCCPQYVTKFKNE